MKNSKIGGQAVIEGVMMRNSDKYAVAVRKPDHEIEVKTFDITNDDKVSKIPIIRGIVTFVRSLAIGMKALTFSSEFFEEEPATTAEDKKKKERETKVESVFVVAFSILLAIAIFMAIPYLVSKFFVKWIDSNILLSLIEGAIRIIFFFVYVIAISRMDDIKRVFSYHGAEHKCINCLETGNELTVENVRNASRFHKRCGTSFLFLVMIVSVIFYCFINVDGRLLQFLIRLVLIPAIAGVSYEFVRLAGSSEGKLINILSKPGLWLQHLTTREPSDDMIEVGIASVEAVFDWQEFLDEYYRDEEAES
ncbi:MAG: DUF1385 domain-containing protein [Lachnospiraceae bacterium]|nr:DUF1385 domain-containing protein [Lachnospiraceae bacterium]